MKKAFLIFSAILIFNSCNKNSKEDDKSRNNFIKSNYFSFEQFLELKDKALNEGSSYAYDNILVYFSANESQYYELLPISIIMSDKYNNLKSNIVIYETIIKIYNNGLYDDKFLLNLSKPQQEFALFYLEKGARKKIPSCVITLEKLYREGIGVEKNEKIADSLGAIDIKTYPVEH